MYICLHEGNADNRNHVCMLSLRSNDIHPFQTNWARSAVIPFTFTVTVHKMPHILFTFPHIASRTPQLAIALMGCTHVSKTHHCVHCTLHSMISFYYTQILEHESAVPLLSYHTCCVMGTLPLTVHGSHTDTVYACERERERE